MRFAAAWSAWWLVPLLPVAVLLAVLLYVRQSRAAARGHAWGLTALRAFVLAAAITLAFRPSLVRRDIATYPGRLLLVLDDSASMGIPDPALPEADALRVSRQALDRLAGRPAPAADLREEIVAIESALIRFERLNRGADRSRDAFWREADHVQSQVDERLETVAERAADLAKGPGDPAKLNEAAARCRELKAALLPLFTGDRPPPGEFGVKMRTALAELADLLGAAQYAADRAALEGGDKALAEAVAAVRGARRLDLAYAWLRRHRDALTSAAGELNPWLLPLSQPEPIRLSKIGPAAPPVSEVETDLSGVLLRSIEEDNPFPLAGILVFGDGRNLGEVALGAVTRAAALRSIPVHAAGVGGAEEPPDVAVRDLYYPPFAVAAAPLGVRARVKTVLPAPGNVELDLLDDAGNTLTNRTLEIKGSLEARCRPVFTPEAEGLQRLTVRARDVEGEVLPRVNNSQDLTVRVRAEPVRVLFLDWKPRWESRFALNILGRLDYLDVNSIIGLAQPEGALERGVGRGFWPENASALDLYDLVILGDLPAGLLTEDEWRQLSAYVEAGGSLVLLGTGRRDPLPAAAAQALLPTQPRRAETPAPSDTATLQLTPAGLNHPVTRALRGVVQSAGAPVADRRRNDTIVLLQTSDGRALIAARFNGNGKTLFVDTDRLWRLLNANALDAHAALVAAVADWAVEGAAPSGNQPRPDLYRYTTREPVEVWIRTDGATNRVVELRDGERLREAPALPPHPGATVASAAFEPLPAGDWTVTLRDGGTAPEPLRVISRSRELYDLARDEEWLRALAAGAGGACVEFTEARRLLNEIEPRSRVERRERVWRLWDSPWLLGALIVMLTIEWVWRKLAGLV